MPGFNQRGPNNEGPMTGWKRGRCVQGQTPDDNGQAYGSGYGAGPGGGFGSGRRGGARGGRFGRGRGQGCGFGPAGYAPEPGATVQTQFLSDRIQALEAELAALKGQAGD